MPKDMNPSFFAEAGHIGRVMRDFKLLEIDIGGVGINTLYVEFCADRLAV